MPNLILQPIVENALEHGVSRTSGQALVEIEARRDGERLHLTVRDNGPGKTESADQNEGVGLRNTRARLQQLYGEYGSVVLSDAQGGGAIAAIILPFHTGSDLRIAAVRTETRS